MISFSPTIKFDPGDLRLLRHRLAVEQRKVQRMSKLPWDMVRTGQLFARSITPIFTKTLFKAIKHKGSDKNKAELYVDTNILQTNPTLKKSNKRFNYAKYMHEHNGDMGRGVIITSGDPQFMWTTRDFLLKELRTKIKIGLGGK